MRKMNKKPWQLSFALLAISLCGPLNAQRALLWIPAEDSDKSPVINLLETRKDLKLTAALGALPRLLEEKARTLSAEGRLEPALRAQGDPLLPLFYYSGEQSVSWANKPSTPIASNDQYFLALRLAQARDFHIKTFKSQPLGLVNPPGGFLSDYLPLARALGLKWAATGPALSTAAAVPECGGIYAVPFTEYSARAADAPAVNFFVFDETAPGTAEKTRAELLNALAAEPAGGWLTVSEALKVSMSTPSSAAEIAAARPWGGDYSPWAAAPAQLGTLAAFAKTRADLLLYLNEKQGDYKAAHSAFDAYFSAEDTPRLARLASTDTVLAAEAETETQSALADVYRIMGKNPPAWLFSSLAQALKSEPGQDKLFITADASGFRAANSSRKPALPANPPVLSKDSDPYKVWKFPALEAAIEKTETIFKFYQLQTDNSSRSPAGFSHARFDLYIDINHRARAGSTKLLEGAAGRLFPDNAWDYALKIFPGRAELYLATDKGPKLLGSFPARFENEAVTVRAPRTLLAGNPLTWGYIGLLLAPDGEKKHFITDYIASDLSNGYFYAFRPR